MAVIRLPDEELHRFGTVVTDERWMLTRFREKVKNPESNLVSMGVYIFSKNILRDWLEGRTGHDFGRNIFPKMAIKGRVFAYLFDGYWRDIGTVESYWQSNMDVLQMSQPFLNDDSWPIYTKETEYPPAKICQTARISNCLLSEGSLIEGHVERSIISSGVRISEGAVVRDSIIMGGTVIGRDCIIDRSILDKRITVGEGCRIGFGDDYRVNRASPKVLNTGLTIIGKRSVIPPGCSIGRNCIVYDNVAEGDFPGSEVASGETVRPRRKPIRIKA